MKKIILPALAASMILFSGCMGGASGTEDAGTGANGVVVGPTCQGGGPDSLCVALRYVTYTNDSGKPSVSHQQAATNIAQINQAWQQCGIGFQIEEYEDVNPEQFGLTYSTANQSELDGIRRAFMTPDKLLVVTTGKWDRSGSLGNTGANAWTSMPGEGVDGAILESSVGNFPLIIAHELGHYINLDHVSDTSNMMNPVIYDNSTHLTESQCAQARDAIEKYWAPMKR